MDLSYVGTDKLEEGQGNASWLYPSDLSSVPFIWKCNEEKYSMKFVSGFVRTVQNETTLELYATIGWFIAEQQEI